MGVWRRSSASSMYAQLAVIAAVIFAITPVLSGPAQFVPGLLSLMAPGWSSLRAAAPTEIPDKAVLIFLSIVLSLVIDLLLGLLLFVVGVLITKTSVALSLAVVELMCAVWIILMGPSLSSRHSRTSSNAKSTIGWAAVMFRSCVFLLAGATLISGVVIVHGLAPHPKAAPYIWLTQSGKTNLVSRGPGPLFIPFAIHSSNAEDSAATVEETLDGMAIGTPRSVVIVGNGTTVSSVGGDIPQLNGCIHRIAIILKASKYPQLDLTRYVTGSGGRC